MLNISFFHFNAFSVNTWLVWDDSGEAFIVDPGCSRPEEQEALERTVQEHGLKVSAILLTHGHIDHVMGVKDCCDRFGVKAYLGADERPAMPDHWRTAEKFGLADRRKDFDPVDVRDGDVLTLAGVQWKAIATPGHSPGGVSWWSESEKILFSGDTLFKETIGRTDLPHGSYDDLIVSVMDKLMGLPGDTDVLPGHGAPTKISHERTHNPFLQPWGEPQEEEPDWEGTEGIELDGR